MKTVRVTNEYAVVTTYYNVTDAHVSNLGILVIDQPDSGTRTLYNKSGWRQAETEEDDD